MANESTSSEMVEKAGEQAFTDEDYQAEVPQEEQYDYLTGKSFYCFDNLYRAFWLRSKL